MERSIDDAYRRYFPIVRAKCSRLLGDADEAQDVAQETILRLWSARFEGDEKAVTAWLYRTATRLAIDRLRSRAPLSAGDFLEERADTTAPTDHALHARRMLHRLAGVMPRRELEIAVLHRVDLLTQAEIGEVTSLSDRTVRRLLLQFDERLARLGWEVES